MKTKINAGQRLSAATKITASPALVQLWKKITGMIVADGNAKITEPEDDSGGTSGVITNEPMLVITAAQAKAIASLLARVPDSSIVIAVESNKLLFSIYVESDE